MKTNNKHILKQGVTLVELLIYIVLSSIIMTMVIQFSRDNTIQSVKNIKRMAVMKSISNVTNYVSEDLRQIGYKAIPTTSSSSGYMIAEVYNDPASDSSSFNFTDSSDVDKLEYKYYNQATNQVDSVFYSVVGDELRRQGFSKAIGAGSWVNQGTLVMAEGVTRFDLEFGIYMNETTNGQIFYEENPDFVVNAPITKTVGSGVDQWTSITGFVDDATTYEMDFIPTTSIDVEQGKNYRLEFDFLPDSDISTNFNQDSNHLAFIFLDASGNPIDNLDNFTFYAGPFDAVHRRIIEFSPGIDQTIDLRLRARIPPGTISIRKLAITMSDDGVYDYRSVLPTTNTATFKKRVNSLKVTINIQKMTRGGNNNAIEDEITKIIPIKNNGT